MIGTHVRRGFIEHGHLYGETALLVAFGGPYAADHVISEWKAVGRVHFAVTDQAEAEVACKVALLLRQAGCQCLSASVPPGVLIPCDWLAYTSVLVVDTLDFEVADLDTRIGSVSVHHWPGSGVLDTLQRNVEACYGRFLILKKEDIGDAKVWLANTCSPAWKILPEYPFNDLEAAELAEMFADNRR